MSESYGNASAADRIPVTRLNQRAHVSTLRPFLLFDLGGRGGHDTLQKHLEVFPCQILLVSSKDFKTTSAQKD